MKCLRFKFVTFEYANDMMINVTHNIMCINLDLITSIFLWALHTNENLFFTCLIYNILLSKSIIQFELCLEANKLKYSVNWSIWIKEKLRK